MTPADIRFAADGMLQSLATWLRLLGYDCAAGPGLFGRHLLEVAAAEQRVALTRRVNLADNLPRSLLQRVRVHTVRAGRLPDQLREVVSVFGLSVRAGVFTRCLDCNAALRELDRGLAATSVPPLVAAREQVFWRCEPCGRTFWRGSHVRDSLRRLHQWLAAPLPGAQ
jgi:uncharacterized protein with PIN domain